MREDINIKGSDIRCPSVLPPYSVPVTHSFVEDVCSGAIISLFSSIEEVHCLKDEHLYPSSILAKIKGTIVVLLLYPTFSPFPHSMLVMLTLIAKKMQLKSMKVNQHSLGDWGKRNRYI